VQVNALLFSVRTCLSKGASLFFSVLETWIYESFVCADICLSVLDPGSMPWHSYQSLAHVPTSP